MKDKRTRLLHQINVMKDWLESHAYEPSFTQEKAEKALTAIGWAWNALERRKETRRGPYEHKG